MLDKLEFLIALDREKHFGRAAEVCGVAQPTLSLGIQSLEEMLNVPLVRRSSRFQGFTAEGEKVLVWARRMVGDARAMQEEILDLKQGVGSRIRIAAMPSAMAMVANMTTLFQVRHPTVKFTVMQRLSADLMELLHQREIDIGLTYIDNEPLGDVIKVPVRQEQFMLLTTVHGPGSERGRMMWAQAASLPLCLLTRDLQQRRIVDSALSRVGAEATPVVETDSHIALGSFVRSGRWASIVPASALDWMDMRDGLVAIPITNPRIVHTIGLVVSERYQIPQTIASFLESARASVSAAMSPAVLASV